MPGALAPPALTWRRERSAAKTTGGLADGRHARRSSQGHPPASASRSRGCSAKRAIAVTMAARRPEKLEAAAEGLADAGSRGPRRPGQLGRGGARSSGSSPSTASATAASTCSSTTPASASRAPVGEIDTKRLDMQLDVNLRSIILFYRECVEMLKAAGAEHGNALVVNTASIAGKRGIAGNSVYSATQARRRRLHGLHEQGAQRSAASSRRRSARRSWTRR